MGYKTEINYIAKISSKPESDQIEAKTKLSMIESNGDIVNFLRQNLLVITFTKEQNRSYVINSPIFLANSDWEVIGRGIVISQLNKNNKTKIEFRILDIYDIHEREIVSKLIQRCEESNDSLE